MTLLKNPKMNVFYISMISALYAFLFIFTSNHIEFNRLISHPNTLNSWFWNMWSEFIANGNMKYFGYVIIILTIVIIMLILFGKKKYDEYQVNILARSLIVAFTITVLILPVALILILSDPNYAIETMFMLLTIQWLSTLIVDLVYSVKYFK
ncbi:hypothetical protein EHE19_005790 [Ruminiclostridium herbifermentans]|uniref:Uncharacterized protein n=1 Tax=Ruminiclostridium herbifermentans TaxID=2488810 RepID=A0A4U7JG37_9FIRM|nr:hypothetical protein [Ruminiclostridium herbifermentans]QNU67954.1 hypothetical protein EHE19_005790 [Ruminiclostridium herbifermentans]